MNNLLQCCDEQLKQYFLIFLLTLLMGVNSFEQYCQAQFSLNKVAQYCINNREKCGQQNMVKTC